MPRKQVAQFGNQEYNFLEIRENILLIKFDNELERIGIYLFQIGFKVNHYRFFVSSSIKKGRQ